MANDPTTSIEFQACRFVRVLVVAVTFAGCGPGVQGQPNGVPGSGTGGSGTTGGSNGARTGGSVGTAGATASGGSGSGGAPLAGTGGTGAGPPVGTPTDGPVPTMLPTVKGSCPTIANGNLTFLGQPVTIWAGTRPATGRGPMVIYWYATGSNPQETLRGLGQATINEITGQGGLVAAPGATNRRGTNTGNGVWYTGDFETVDEVVACAIQQLNIDTRRIYASGFSAGGLQTTRMAYDRSGYLAAVVPYSGGITGFGAGSLQDAGNVPAAMVVHGAQGSDVVIIDFASASASYETDIEAKGGFSIDCNHGGGHMIPSSVPPSSWSFMKAHPFRVSPRPFLGGIPAGFPTFCKIP